MKEIYTGKIDIYGHHETRSARSVSELLGGSQDPVEPHYAKDRIDDLARAAAYAAKPFMDVAVDMYSGMKKLDYFSGLSSEDILNADPKLATIIDYARMKSDRVASGAEHGGAVTNLEQAIIDAYTAAASQNAEKDSIGDEYISGDELSSAIEEAYSRSKSASDTEDKKTLTRIYRRLIEFDDHFENDDEISRQRFGDLLDNASYLLDVANAGNRNVQPDEIANIGDIRRDTLNMRKNEEMFKFLAKLTKEKKGVPSPPYSGLSEEYVERMREQIAGTKTSSGGTRANPSANEVSERGKIDIPDTWPQRRDYVEAWFQEHGTKITPDSLEVARQWVAKTVEALARAKRKAVEGDPSLKNTRYAGNVSGVFGSGYSLGGDFSDVDKIIIGQLRETDPNITNVSNQDYARMGIREIAAALGLNLKDTTPDFDEIFR